MSQSSSLSVVTHGAARGLRRALFASAAAVLLFAGVHAYSGDTQPAASAAARPLKVLLLGEGDATHSTTALYTSLAPFFARHGIQITHATTAADALTPQVLGDYDILLLYGTLATITPAQEQALVGFVESGKGLVALNSAVEMFPSSSIYAALIGARGKRTGAVQFTAEPTQAASPITRGAAADHHDRRCLRVHERGDGRPDGADGTGRERRRARRRPGPARRARGACSTPPSAASRRWRCPRSGSWSSRACSTRCPRRRKQAWDGLKMPDGAVRGRAQRPELREPRSGAEVSAAADRRRVDEVHPGAGRASRSSCSPPSRTSSSRSRSRSTSAAGCGSSKRSTIPTTCCNGEPGDDRIKIVEDTNGDGKADKFTVFADHLNIPTSLTFANGGVIVAAAPDMLFLKDTDGDGKADVRKVLFTGWGIRDTHAGPSNLRYGLDNWIWGVVGYSGFDGEMNGKQLQFRRASTASSRTAATSSS